MRPPRWSKEEVEMLAQIVADHPRDLYPVAYAKWAQENGYPPRTRRAIQRIVSKHHMTDKTCGDWVSAGYICDVLGVSYCTTRRFNDCYGIPAYRNSRGYRHFRRSDLVKAAKHRPAIFGGISADRLFLLLEDRDLADSIAATYPTRGNEAKPVRAVETGRLYPSVRVAARGLHVTQRAIANAIRTGGTSAGYHWTHA